MGILGDQKARLLVHVPSRGRPDNIKRLHEAISDTAAHRVDIVVHCDEDDTELERYYDYEAGLYEPGNLLVEHGPRMRLCEAWNTSRQYWGDYDYIAFWGDDVVPRTSHWDQILTHEIDARNGLAIVYGRDGYWDWSLGKRYPRHLELPSHTIIGVPMLEALGWACPPVLTHYYLDNAWRDIGLRTRTLVHVNEVLIEHLHHLAGKSEEDATYIEARPLMETDRRAYMLFRGGKGFRDACDRVHRAKMAR